eukprot:CAMPEP_0206451696 /NCGR_PEP_ID=MMETSP0324_2-20121206/19499_1 /ASSEMBLY_ACC=CAM_ASM_000836 /TAXON_ID=2866 /ORGANISM="Crypthecodinium cohnii, Strain Seligo" /LENGTH=295 /DNA_ID=CAMNT_0053921635 /DNA_START=271 /DNA_END=1158 /DNA_ORIENTATION=-
MADCDAGVVMKNMYLDTVPHFVLCSILKWAGSSQFSIFPPEQVSTEVFAQLFGGSVFRSAAVELLVSQQEWSQLVTTRGFTRVRPYVIRLGNTSFALRMAFETTDAKDKNHVPKQLARMEFIKVMVDPKTLTTPVPIANPADLRRLCQPDAVPEVKAPKTFMGPKPSNAFVWKAVVRQSDCDALQHVNNAVYGQLVEDARAEAALAGALPESLAKASSQSGFIKAAIVEYLGQPHRGEHLNIAVWYDEDEHKINFEFEVEETQQVACKVSMVCGDHPVVAGGPFVGSSMARPAKL